MVKPTFAVALDPGSVTGVAVYSYTQKKVLGWFSRDFWSVQDFMVNSFEDRTSVEIFVEVPATYFAGRDPARLSKNDLRIIYNSGGVRREALLLIEGLKRLGFTLVTAVPPVTQKKWTAEKLYLATGSNARSNEHEKDSVRLVLKYAGRVKV